MKHIIAIPFVLILISCQQEEYPKCPEIEDVKEEAVEKKPSAESIKEILDYVNEKTKDMVIMQQYFIGFLKRGASRNQNEQEANEIQKQHMEHLGSMHELGYVDISGPFGDFGDIRGITIYNLARLKMANSLANLYPAVKAGRLKVEVHPWWAAK